MNELTGGLAAWEADDLPTECEARAPWALERQVRVAAGTIVLLGLALSLVWPWALALSWFVGAGLVFAGLTDWCGMGRLLAKGRVSELSERFGDRQYVLRAGVEAETVLRELEDRGILVTWTGKSTLAEEIPEAYKDVSQVVNVVSSMKTSRPSTVIVTSA